MGSSNPYLSISDEEIRDKLSFMSFTDSDEDTILLK